MYSPSTRALLAAILINDFEYAYDKDKKGNTFKYTSLTNNCYIGLTNSNNVEFAAQMDDGFLVFTYTPYQNEASCYGYYVDKSRMETVFLRDCKDYAYKVPQDEIRDAFFQLMYYMTSK